MHWLFVIVSTVLAPPGAAAPECAGCHRAESEKHASSRHAVAWDNPLFRHEYDDHPKAWCVSCHAPEVLESERATPPGPIASRGVSCQGCHLQGGRLVSRQRSAFSIHDTHVDASFGRSTDCARCHQFNFPLLDERDGALLRYTDEPMQNTVAEAMAAGLECDGCHDPHRAAGSHSIPMVRRALDRTLCRDGGDVVFTVTNHGAGHNVPTGGVHRNITARMWRSSAPARVVSMVLGREFNRGEDGARRTRVDTTLPIGHSRELRVSLRELGGTAAEPINAELRYNYSLRGDATLLDGSRAQRSITRDRILPHELTTCR